jgi:peptidoglycan LD-endopeptidase CwlK
MSNVLFKEDVKFLQRFLCCNGFDTKGIDGSFGKNTDAALKKFDEAFVTIRNELGAFDQRSENNIYSVGVPTQREIRKFLRKALDAGFDVRVLSGTRTYAEQNALFAKGRTKPGQKVTNARGGSSNHNFGIAWDIGIFKNGEYIANDVTPYKEVAEFCLTPTLEWGGNWKTFKDTPHFQLATGKTIKQLRDAFEAGKKIA